MSVDSSQSKDEGNIGEVLAESSEKICGSVERRACVMSAMSTWSSIIC